jgi:repressor LexA
VLTRKQQVLLNYICERLNSDGISPSFEEMKLFLGLRSKSGVHRLVKALEERGFIERLSHRARAIQVLKMPGEATVLSSKRKSKLISKTDLHPTPNIVRGKFPKFEREPRVPKTGSNPERVIPLLGRIAAGTPIEALQHPDDYLSLPDSLISSKDCYALEVSGSSMIEAGILDGDIVVIERCETADNGSIVVALIHDHEATLKRLRQKGDSVALESANPAYETRIFGPEQVKIQGILRGLIRNY